MNPYEKAMRHSFYTFIALFPPLSTLKQLVAFIMMCQRTSFRRFLSVYVCHGNLNVLFNQMEKSSQGDKDSRSVCGVRCEYQGEYYATRMYFDKARFT